MGGSVIPPWVPLNSAEDITPYQLIVHDGLITSLTDMYDRLQEYATDNITAVGDCLIASPGFKITSNEFDTTVIGDMMIINLGIVVFHDYSVFVPGMNQLTVNMELPDPSDYATGSTLYITMDHDQVDSHEYDVKAGVTSITSANAITMDTAVVRIKNAITGNDLVIAEIEVSGRRWFVRNRRFDFIMRVTRSQRIGWSGAAASEAEPVISSVTARSYNLSDFRLATTQLAGSTVNLNTMTPPARMAPGSILAVEWPAPSAALLNLRGGVAYYKVIAIPMSERPSDHPSYFPAESLESIVYHTASDGDTVRCVMPCNNGTLYNVRVHEIDDTLEHILAGAPLSTVILGGSDEYADYDDEGSPDPPDTITLNLAVNWPFSSDRVVQISPRCDLVDSSSYIYHVFLKEYTSDPGSATLTIRQLPLMIYEGPLTSIYHTLQTATTHFEVQATLTLRAGRLLLGDSGVRRIIADDAGGGSESTSNEIPLALAANNIIIPDPPPDVPTSFVLATWDDVPNFSISRLVCSLPQGCEVDGEMEWGNTAGDILIPNGGQVTITIDATSYTVDFDTDGKGYEEFSPHIEVPAGSTFTISVGHDSHGSYPLNMLVVIYIDNRWRWDEQI